MKILLYVIVPSFGSRDLTIYGGYGGLRNESNFCSNGYNYCRKAFYEKNIRVSDYTFSVEDYEVFQIIKNYVYVIMKLA